ncbi:piezo-type mechanosensitive ion channel homolog isoform X1 [Cryptomeria japonica]|uniref:piezo-type mechanosensitive ion channel homolog isoform X1 n=2 Tax=Cryptomeria japonica TaxID=3369 RepID=UPI0027DAA748|nr:piezo-type mechanosensitive ion channel homolog isoform X1 [Cryptomeria japonica]
MRGSDIGALASVLLLTAALLDWSLISLLFLIAFLIVQYIITQRGQNSWKLEVLWFFVIVISVMAILAESGFYTVWSMKMEKWRIAGLWWAKLIGFTRLNPWKGTAFVYILFTTQLAVVLVATIALHASKTDHLSLHESSWRKLLSSLLHFGFQLKILFRLALPGLQLLVGVSHPSWMSLPFFMCSCMSLLNWCLRIKIAGISWCRRPLLLYSALNILLLYVYQLPVFLPSPLSTAADYLGLYKVSTEMGWPAIISGVSLLAFYIVFCSVIHDLKETELEISPFYKTYTSLVCDGYTLTRSGNDMTEHLLPSQLPNSDIGAILMTTQRPELSIGVIFQHVIINFFIYGYPVSLLALSLWSFNYGSIFAFGLVIYIGYVLYVFPSIYSLHRVNVFLLSFILVWVVSTYAFNATFDVSRMDIKMDATIWDTIGLYHYSIPGVFIFSQFCLGTLVAVLIFVNNCVFSSLNHVVATSVEEQDNMKEESKTKVLILAIAAWCFRRSSRSISLLLMFSLGMKLGLLHAIYMVFFLIYLMKSTIGRRVRKILVLLCEVHFALLYLLRLDLISKSIGHKGDLMRTVLFHLGLSNHASVWEFANIALLLCFTAIQIHGLEVLLSLATIIQQSPQPPFGIGFMKVGFNKFLLLTIYSPHDLRYSHLDKTPLVSWITKYLSYLGQRSRELYRAWGTYIASLTILATVYFVSPNYVSFGYLFFLLIWIIGRQLGEKTRRRLWLPLMIYAILVFVLIYVLSNFPNLQAWLSSRMPLYSYMGFRPGASLIKNVWESLLILIVMQLHRYERMESSAELPCGNVDESIQSNIGIIGFVKRFLIWHSGKVLAVAVFYASISPVSAFGFIYLITLLFTTRFPKTSRFPAKFYTCYTGFLIAFEYLFQMWGSQAQMFPGQKLADLSTWLGLKVFGNGFWGIESGLRSKFFVIVACTLQYNVFRWLEQLPSSLINTEECEEPCHLFISHETKLERDAEAAQERSPLLARPLYQEKCHLDGDFDTDKLGKKSGNGPCSLFGTQVSLGSGGLGLETGLSDHSPHEYSISSFWGSSRESHKWNKKVLFTLRKERYEAQLCTVKLYAKFWVENFFNLFGLEMNMLTLLLASFIVLNSISLFYVAVLGLCILLNKKAVHLLWPVCVFLFACILIIEYLALGNVFPQWTHHDATEVHCHNCWDSSKLHYSYCIKCWLGVVVDDRQMLVTYFMVFFIASLKLRASGNSSAGYLSDSYHQLHSQRINTSVWEEILFETKGQWTWFDHLRLFFYRHLLDVVLMLVLITGTLEYDILHLGYLGFALVFFRMRHTIMKKKNRIFRLLRLYNFLLIVLSLVFQAPFFGDVENGTHSITGFLYGVVGLYKYDYGFRITSRSALVDIIIFCLLSLQSFIFQLKAFDEVLNYIEAEKIDAMLHSQEKKAAWKTAQLQHSREIEERKQKRRMQVEKTKVEMTHLQSHLTEPYSARNHSNPCLACQINNQGSTPSQIESMDKIQHHSEKCNGISTKQQMFDKLQHEQLPYFCDDNVGNLRSVIKRKNSHLQELPCPTITSRGGRGMDEGSKEKIQKQSSNSPTFEITELEEPVNGAQKSESIKGIKIEKGKEHKENPLASAVQLIGDGVAQVHSLGNQAVANIVNFFNIEQNDSDFSEVSSAEDKQNDLPSDVNDIREFDPGLLDGTLPLHTSQKCVESDEKSEWFRKLSLYCWSKIQSNTDAICYACFVLVFLWNFSLLTMFYLAVLFLYALLVNPGPSHFFWLAMLIYTELNIFIQYAYQIGVNHCGLKIGSHLRWEIGFPTTDVTSSFVTTIFPLFIVYFSTLIQSSIKARDGEWMLVTENVFHGNRMTFMKRNYRTMQLKEMLGFILHSVINTVKMTGRGLRRYWDSLIHGSESPPYFVQISMNVMDWPHDGIQPEKIESAINRLLDIYHKNWCKEISPLARHLVSRVRVESIENSSEDANVALAVFEVINVSSLSTCPESAKYMSLTPAADVACELQRAKEAGLIEKSGFPYPIISVIAGGKREIDLYAYIFCADLVAFFLVAIFYQSMIKHNNQFLDVYQLEDQFPKEFVFVLMVLFFLIMVDRIIYLCSFALGKVISYFFSLVLFTYSVTEFAWNMESQGQYSGEFALRAFYLTKAVSLSLQALQIKFGLPHKSMLYGQFLTSRVTNTNHLGFRIYRALPFLYELRCVLDWSCTTTSLTMYDWLKLEDIYASLYLVKCDIALSRAKHCLGEKQSKTTKFCSGICLFLVLIFVIWAPMLMYSSGNPTNIANPIKDVSTQIDIKTGGGRLTLYQNTLCECLLWEDLLAAGYNLDPQDYLKTYNIKDIQLICCRAESNTLWLVPPSVVKSLMESIDNESAIMFSWEFTRDRPKGKEVVRYNPSEPADSSGLLDVLNGTSDVAKMFKIYPRYLRVTGSGEVHELEQVKEIVNGSLVMNQGASTWWSFHPDNASDIEGCGSFTGPSVIVVSEETPQGFIGDTLSKFSIWSLYITFVLAVGRFIRLQCSDLRMRIPFENFPSCDRLTAICEDIYAARAEGELKLEELLFGTLVNIYRSPHVLLEYTKDD